MLRLFIPLILVATTAIAQPPARYTGPLARSDSAIKITLLTMGQGDALFEYFGHNAIWVQDPTQPFDLVYNWGVFDFRSPGFLTRFLRGDMRYILDTRTIDQTIAEYRWRNRPIWAQELDLTPHEKRALVDFVRWNALPQNKEYQYNYYLDNCSTRVRDALDRVLGGRLRGYLKGIPTDQTYRSHSLRLMQADPVLMTGVQFALGRLTDVKLSGDEASFLPRQLMNYVRDFKVDGSRPLVTREYTLLIAVRGDEPTNVPALWKALVPIGLGFGGLIALLGWRAGAGRRRALAVVVAIVAGLIGIIGLILALLATVTTHVASHWNENVFLLNPLWLVLAVAVPMLILRGRAERVAKPVAIVAGALALCAIGIHLVLLSRQPNWDVIGLLLPAELTIVAIALAPSYRGRLAGFAFAPVTRSGRAKNST